MIHVYRRRVFGYECDIYGHLNNANYLHLYEEARSVFLEDIDLPVRKLMSMGIAIYVTKVNLEFIKGILLESEVVIKSWVVSGSRLRGLWQQEMFVADELCSRITIEGVYASNGKPRRLPPEVWVVFEKYINKQRDL
ncbi:MAG: acyl-CoA thioesterase [Candidatus Cloacimonetes bacterium]|nr:acyl-CoA thioesterase [Candidatus Cloacimonadota bacterium]